MRGTKATKFRHFLDSNVVLYLLSADNHKADQAERLLTMGPVISVQVLNEVAHVCRRKLQMTWEDITQFLTLVRGFCKVVPLTETIHDQGRAIAARYQLSFYDASIVAAAADARCHTLYTEDMHNRMRLSDEKINLQNPFIN